MDHDVAFASFTAPMPFRAPSFSFDPTRRPSEDFLFHSHDYSGFGVPQGIHQPAAQSTTPYLGTTTAYIPGRGSFSIPYSFLGPEQPAFLQPVSYFGAPYADLDSHLMERPRQLSFSAPPLLKPSLQPMPAAPLPDQLRADAYGASGWAYLFPDSAHPQGVHDATVLANSVKSETASELPSPSAAQTRSSESHEMDADMDMVDADNEPSASPAEESRDWACPVSNCGKSYRFKGDLKYHVKRKHPERLDLPSTISKPRSAKEGKTYPCPVATCACGFKWARDLRRHIKTKHPENEDESSSGSSSSTRSKFKSARAKGKPHASKPGAKTRASAEAAAAADGPSFVTLSISSFYDDSDSMLQLPDSSERN